MALNICIIPIEASTIAVTDGLSIEDVKRILNKSLEIIEPSQIQMMLVRILRALYIHRDGLDICVSEHTVGKTTYIAAFDSRSQYYPDDNGFPHKKLRHWSRNAKIRQLTIDDLWVGFSYRNDIESEGVGVKVKVGDKTSKAATIKSVHNYICNSGRWINHTYDDETYVKLIKQVMKDIDPVGTANPTMDHQRQPYDAFIVAHMDNLRGVRFDRTWGLDMNKTACEAGLKMFPVQRQRHKTTDYIQLNLDMLCLAYLRGCAREAKVVL